MARNAPQGEGIGREHALEMRLGPEVWAALEAYRAERGARRSDAVRGILEAALRASGHLAPIRVPEDAPGLEDAYGYPWPTAPGPEPRLLAWWSRDPERPTWATLLRAMEEETATPLAEIARRHGVSANHAALVFRRYDRWRRGEDPMAARTLGPAKLPRRAAPSNEGG